MKRGPIATALAVIITVLAATVAEATHDLGRARAATAAFHSFEAATAAGYGGPVQDAAGITCIASAPGVMGVHYVRGDILFDGVLDAATPELLVYQPLPNGELRLVALEYLVFQGDWLAAGNTTPPTLFGQTLTLVPAGNRYGLPPFYEIHAWIWMNNPSGMFQDWNPSGSCA
jgi:hypothetical protein